MKGLVLRLRLYALSVKARRARYVTARRTYEYQARQLVQLLKG